MPIPHLVLLLHVFASFARPIPQPSGYGWGNADDQSSSQDFSEYYEERGPPSSFYPVPPFYENLYGAGPHFLNSGQYHSTGSVQAQPQHSPILPGYQYAPSADSRMYRQPSASGEPGLSDYQTLVPPSQQGYMGPHLTGNVAPPTGIALQWPHQPTAAQSEMQPSTSGIRLMGHQHHTFDTNRDRAHLPLDSAATSKINASQQRGSPEARILTSRYSPYQKVPSSEFKLENLAATAIPVAPTLGSIQPDSHFIGVTREAYERQLGGPLKHGRYKKCSKCTKDNICDLHETCTPCFLSGKKCDRSAAGAHWFEAQVTAKNPNYATKSQINALANALGGMEYVHTGNYELIQNMLAKDRKQQYPDGPPRSAVDY